MKKKQLAQLFTTSYGADWFGTANFHPLLAQIEQEKNKRERISTFRELKKLVEQHLVRGAGNEPRRNASESPA